MAESFIQLPPNSTGSKLRTFEQTIGGNVVEQQALALVDSAGNVIGSLAAAPAGSEQGLVVRPVLSDVTASGSITATDAVVGAPTVTGALVSGASTAGSLVAMALPGGDASLIAQITGLTQGTLAFEGSIDSTNGMDGHWAPILAQRIGLSARADIATTASGIFRADASGLGYVRVRAVGATLTGNPAVLLRASDASPGLLLDGARTTLTGPLGDEVDTVAGALSAKLSDVDAVPLWWSDPGQRARLTAGSRREVPFRFGDPGAATGRLVVDVSNYAYASLSLSATSTSVSFHQSNDGVVWQSFSGQLLTNVGTIAQAVLGGQVFGLALGARYLRLTVSAGVCEGVLELFTMPRAPLPLPVATVSTTSVNAGSQSNSDAVSGADSRIFGAGAYCWNGASYDRLRIATKFATVTATASGNTTIVTPTAGKKFRLLAYAIEVTADAAITGGGDLDITLNDAGTALGMGFSVFCPGVAGTTFGNSSGTGWRQISNGALSAAANNLLQVNLSAALTSGKCRGNVAYCEE